LFQRVATRITFVLYSYNFLSMYLLSFNGDALLELIITELQTLQSFRDIRYNYSPLFELDSALSFLQ